MQPNLKNIIFFIKKKKFNLHILVKKIKTIFQKTIK